MKLYISYYDNYISIVEGRYNSKKEKFIIKNIIKLSVDNLNVDNKDKFYLLKESLKNNKFKSKDVVFMLNTRDVIIKSNTLPKVNKIDLDKIMNNEIYDIMSLDPEEYIFSYEVTNERKIENREILDIVIAALSRECVNEIIDIFKELNLNLKSIDTMSTAYIRLLKNIEHEEIMVVNAGRYGSFCNVYVNGSLFISDDIPIKISNIASFNTILELADEINGLSNFYSSRNFGNRLKKILFVGEIDNNKVKEILIENLNDKVTFGIENLYYISEDIEGNLSNEEINSISEILGCMLADNTKHMYSFMNLLPLELKNKISNQTKLKKNTLLILILTLVLISPYFIFTNLEKKLKEDINNLENSLQGTIEIDNNILNIEEEIKVINNEIEFYDTLINKKTNWTSILNSIEETIPYLLDLTEINAYYDEDLENTSLIEEDDENIINNEDTDININEFMNNSEIEQQPLEKEVFEKIPNIISLQGLANSSEKIGQYVYKLNELDYFDNVKLKYIEKDKEKQIYNFEIILRIREKVISSE